MKTPIVFIIFNRPALASKVWQVIRDAKPERLFVIADGPRETVPEDKERCAATRRVVEAGADWPCEIVRLYSDTNLGCGRRISSGLSEVFRLSEEAIILEDDCLPDPSFFPFCEELLARYRHDPRVAQIGGSCFQGMRPTREGPSYFFSRYPHCWGWATWRRAWANYDHEMRIWRDDPGAGWLDRVVSHRDERRYWRQNFGRTAGGLVDSWAYRWTLAVFKRGDFCVSPKANLVLNIGFGVDATHTTETGPLAERALEAATFPLVHPSSFAFDDESDERSSRQLFRSPGIGRRLFRRLARWVK